MEAIQIEEELSDLEVSRRKMYYSRVYALMEMVNFSRNRETCFLNGLNRKDNVRLLNCGSVEGFMRNLGLQTNLEKSQNKEPADPWHFFNSKKNYNIYFSLGTINWANCPIKALSYSSSQRKGQQEFFKENIIDYMTDFDGAMDFDGDLSYDSKGLPIHLEISRETAVNRALKDLKIVKNIFDNHKIQYFINFSGNRGFHIVFKIPLNIPVIKKCELAESICQTIRTTLDLKTLDNTKLHLRKILKTSYSICTTDKTRAVLPLTDQQIENFSLNIVDVDYVLKNIKLKNRGVLWRNEKLNKEESINNFTKLINNFEIEVKDE